MSVSAILLAPYRWFTNIVTIQERRPFHIFTVLLFSTFVAIARMLGEWALGGHGQLFLTDFLISFAFYFFCFFLYTSVLWLLVPQPWQRSMNVVLIGIFLGIFPPLIDACASGIGHFRYGYLWNFPTDFSPTLYNPEKRLPLGESLTLWATVFFMALYVRHKTRDMLMGVIAAVLAWMAAVFNAALLPTTVRFFEEALSLTVNHRTAMITFGYYFLSLTIYLAFNQRLFFGLLARSVHTLPFVLITVAGAAFTGPLRPETFFYAFIVGISFLVALGHNDWHDRKEDAQQGRALYLDEGDVNFLNIIGFGLAITLLASGSLTGLLVLLILAVSFLYSYPFYRAKRYFPSNLKIEGVWGASAFLIGIISQAEHAVFGYPAWMMDRIPRAFPLESLTAQTAWAIALVFGGYSLIASLKDYKDREVDLQTGVQTWYTLARRRGWDELRMHRTLVTGACLALFAPFPLLAWAGRVHAYTLAGALPAVAAVGALMQGPPSRRRFLWVLAAISTQLAYLIILLGFRYSE